MQIKFCTPAMWKAHHVQCTADVISFNPDATCGHVNFVETSSKWSLTYIAFILLNMN